ncbi:hypothetical protein [Gramella sp. AN32]|uniref:Lipoprotein n=1 Tax=Christiangramia antarctica TaxID=2058158 RepID=A0ABW5X9B2_9FLAO|nr:hypothetical protein [Gramella sp. AN32]MCM4158159.1 hypothetical protein [Gramella sp. AN32]
MKNLFPKILIISFTLLIISCNVDDDDGTSSDLPEITTEGANTFGCNINGQVFLPRDGSTCNFSCGASRKRLSYFKNDDIYQLGITAMNNINGDIRISINLYLEEPLKEQVYELSENYIASIDKIWPNASGCINSTISSRIINSCFGTNSNITGTLEILEINQTEHFIAGIFEFQAINQQGEIVNFTDGRFDMLVYYSNLF